MTTNPEPKFKLTGLGQYLGFYTCPEGYTVSHNAEGKATCIPSGSLKLRANTPNKEYYVPPTGTQPPLAFRRADETQEQAMFRTKYGREATVSPEFLETEQKRSSLCGYLKNKIASEEQESQEYKELEQAVDQFDARKYGYIFYIHDAQKHEIHYLKAIYDKICVNY